MVSLEGFGIGVLPIMDFLEVENIDKVVFTSSSFLVVSGFQYVVKDVVFILLFVAVVIFVALDMRANVLLRIFGCSVIFSSVVGVVDINSTVNMVAASDGGVVDILVGVIDALAVRGIFDFDVVKLRKGSRELLGFAEDLSRAHSPSYATSRLFPIRLKKHLAICNSHGLPAEINLLMFILVGE